MMKKSFARNVITNLRLTRFGEIFGGEGGEVMLGKLLSFPVKVVNVPFRTIEKVAAVLVGDNDIRKEDRILSKPLEKLAEAIEEIDE